MTVSLVGAALRSSVHLLVSSCRLKLQAPGAALPVLRGKKVSGLDVDRPLLNAGLLLRLLVLAIQLHLACAP